MQRQATNNIWSCKYMHGLLPTGNIQHRYNLRERAGCPVCLHSKETWTHVLQCTHAENQQISKGIRAKNFKAINQLAACDAGQAIKIDISTIIGEPYGNLNKLLQKLQKTFHAQEKIG